MTEMPVKHFLLASDFDQTLSFKDSGVVLSEMLGISGFEERVAGLARSNLVQQGGELAYLIRHDPEFRGVRAGTSLRNRPAGAAQERDPGAGRLPAAGLPRVSIFVFCDFCRAPAKSSFPHWMASFPPRTFTVRSLNSSRAPGKFVPSGACRRDTARLPSSRNCNINWASCRTESSTSAMVALMCMSCCTSTITTVSPLRYPRISSWPVSPRAR